MKIKKLLLIILLIIFVTGCTKVSEMSYDDIINLFNTNISSVNTFRRGYKYYIPKGLELTNAGTNYAIIVSNNNYYYLYFDLINYINKNITNYEEDYNAYYSKLINNNDKKGYIIIKNIENEQYLIEIVYNYAKIEVMVDNNKNINEVLINTINILKSVEYDDKVIETLLKDDNLTYTEEVYDMFKNANKKSSILDYSEDNIEVNESVIKDTDFIN